MRKNFFIVSVALLLCSVSLFWACQKDGLDTSVKKEVPKALLSASVREGNPFNNSKIRLEDGMLKFDDYKTFLDTYEALKTMSSNGELNRATLSETGHNPDTDIDQELALIPQHPILKAFASSYGLVSEEQKEEIAFKAYLQTAGEIEDFHGSPVYSPMLQAMLNDKRELKIGTFILKFIDENRTALIYNNNMEVLNSVRNTEIGQLKDGHDLYIIDLLNPMKTNDDIFSRDAEGNPRELMGICDIDFDVKPVSGNTFLFENKSTGTNCTSDNSFIWNFGDNSFNNVTGSNQNITHNFTTNQYPYTVTLTALCGPCKGDEHTIIINEPATNNDPCSLLNGITTFEATKPSGGNSVTFKIPGLTTGMTATIDFGDGSPVGSVLPLIPSSFIHLYPPSVSSPSTFVAVLTVTITGCSTPLVISKPIAITCGHYYCKNTSNSQGYFGGRLWQLSGAIWCQNNKVISDLGSSSQVYRFGLSEIFKYAKNANSLDVDLQGKILDATYDSAGNMTCKDIIINSNVISSGAPASYLSKRPISPPKGMRFEDYVLYSDHHAKIGTGSSSLPLKVEQLYLHDN